MLTPEVLDGYLEGIRPQLGQFLDLSDALLLDNSAWLGTITAIEFLRDVGKHFTVNQMVAKESVKARFERPDQGISYTEFSYMLLQAYDFLRLHLDHGCDLQIGGSDQWGNITMGIELIRKVVPGRGVGPDHAARPQGRRDQVRQDRERHGLARPQAHQPLCHVPVLLQLDRRHGRAATSAYFTFLAHEEIEALDAETADASGTPGRPTGPGPVPWSGWCTARRRWPRREEAAGRPLRRGDRRPERGDAAGRHR